MKVYVVTGINLGWDCVVGVYTVQNEEEYAQLQRAYGCHDDDDVYNYVITEQTVQKFDLASFAD